MGWSGPEHDGPEHDGRERERDGRERDRTRQDRTERHSAGRDTASWDGGAGDTGVYPATGPRLAAAPAPTEQLPVPADPPRPAASSQPSITNPGQPAGDNGARWGVDGQGLPVWTETSATPSAARRSGGGTETIDDGLSPLTGPIRGPAAADVRAGTDDRLDVADSRLSAPATRGHRAAQSHSRRTGPSARATRPRPRPFAGTGAGTGAGAGRPGSASGQALWRGLSNLPPAALIVGLAVVALVVGAIGFLVAGHGGSRPAPAPRVPPNLNLINSAATDPVPVAPNEFFNSPRVSVYGRAYTRLATKLTAGCPTLTGSLRTTLTAAAGSTASTGTTPALGCRQLVQATYLSPPDSQGRQAVVAIAVAVLDDHATAVNAAAIVTAGQGSVTPLPLAANAVPGAKTTNADGDTAWHAGAASGHYLLAVSLAFTDGSAGSATDPTLTRARLDITEIASAPIVARAAARTHPT